MKIFLATLFLGVALISAQFAVGSSQEARPAEDEVSTAEVVEESTLRTTPLLLNVPPETRSLTTTPPPPRNIVDTMTGVVRNAVLRVQGVILFLVQLFILSFQMLFRGLIMSNNVGGLLTRIRNFNRITGTITGGAIYTFLNTIRGMARNFVPNLLRDRR